MQARIRSSVGDSFILLDKLNRINLTTTRLSLSRSNQTKRLYNVLSINGIEQIKLSPVLI